MSVILAAGGIFCSSGGQVMGSHPKIQGLLFFWAVVSKDRFLL
jgi:hypothetical protein